jgi:gliding motility-associated-like protein
VKSIKTVKVEIPGKKYCHKLRFLVLTIILCISAMHDYAQTPSTPALKCASTNAAGAVTLQWEIINQGTVDHYNIYWSNSASGPFSKISFINDGVSVTKQITDVNGNNAQYFFFMRSYNAAGDSSVASVLVSNIFLQMTVTPKGIANLSWNAFDPLVSGIYNLVRTDPFGSSDIIYSGTVLSFRDIITSPYCDSTNLSYRVDFSYTGGCISYSNIKTDEFLDDTKPLDALMDSISIDPNGHPVVSWVASPSADVAGYEIQQLMNGGVWMIIGFAPGNLTTSFTADTIDARTSVKTFAIIAIDQCNNKSTGVGTYPNALNTLLLDPVIGDDCLGTAKLSWNDYNNMKPAFGEYQIFRKEDAGPFTLIGTTGQDTTTFIDNLGFIPGFTYAYFIRAVSLDGQKSSSSCTIQYISKSPPNPDTVLLNFVSVINSQSVEMSIHFGPPETVTSLRVYRAESQSGPYTLIDSIIPGIIPDFHFPDLTAAVNTRSYYYQIVALNSCKLETKFSDLSRTIFLSCVANTNQSNSLSWNEYFGWPSVDRYEINRLVNDVPDPANPIATVLPGNPVYLDPPSGSQQTGDIISYYVTAIGGNVAAPDSSVSNIVRALRQPVVVMPNAFAPKGLNNIFRPVMNFVDEGNYQLVIYNKWGLLVFESTDKNLGWDGKFKGAYAPTGIYFYRLQYSSFTGESFSKMGSLMLVD